MILLAFTEPEKYLSINQTLCHVFQVGHNSLIFQICLLITHALRHRETLQGNYYYNCFVITTFTLALMMVNLLH